MNKFLTLFKLDVAIQNIYGHIVTTMRKVKYSQLIPVMKKNKELVNKENAGRRCYVLGLGPSLKSVDYHKIDGDSFVVNRFDEFDCGDFSPTYYVLADNAFFSGDLLLRLSKMYKMYPNTKFLLDGTYIKNIRSVLPDDDRIFYFFEGNGVLSHKKEIDYTQWVQIKYNVVACAIAMAMYMGYKEIILLGCDFNSFASPKAIHCYDEKDDSRKISLSMELFMYSFASYVHNELALYAKKHGIKILNATEGSLIDVYERIEVEKVL